MVTPPVYCKFGRCYCNYSRRVTDRPIDKDMVKYCRRFCGSPRGQGVVKALIQEKARWYRELGLIRRL